MAIDKQLVKNHFSKGLRTYPKQASVQHNIACKLAEMTSNLGFTYFNKVFEAGCGSGFLTQQLITQLNIEQLTVNDLTSTAKEYIDAIARQWGKKIDFLCGDAEKITVPGHNDAVFSASTLQWFNNLPLFFNKINQCLNPKGLFAFSTFGPDNFREIRHTCQVGLHYPNQDTLKKMLAENFSILAQKEWRETMEFNHPTDVLRHMKKTGVNGLQHEYFGKRQLSRFSNHYIKQFSTINNTVTLTYSPIIIITQKK